MDGQNRGFNGKNVQINLIDAEQNEADPAHLAFATTKINFEMLEKKKEEYGFKSRAHALRYFINIGMRSIAENDPRNTQSDSDIDVDVAMDETGIADVVPEGKQNALNIRQEEVVDAIEENLVEIIDEHPGIKRDGLNVYK